MTYHCGECGLEGGAYDAVFDELRMTKIALDEARAELIDEHARPPGAWDRLIARAEKAEAQVAAVRALCEEAEEITAEGRAGGLVSPYDLRPILDGTA